MDVLKIGTAKKDITAPLTAPYLAFYPRHAAFTGVRTPMYLRALVLEQNGLKTAIIATETFGFVDNVYGNDRSFYKELRDAVYEKSGVLNVMFTGAHIHSTPDTLTFRPLIDAEGAGQWLDMCVDSAAEAVAEAAGDMFEAFVFHGAADVPGYVKNRREILGKRDAETDNNQNMEIDVEFPENTGRITPGIDNALNVLHFVSKHDSRRATILHFACHPVVMQVTENICTDYVGVLADETERRAGGVTLFLQGACGDIDPFYFTPGSHEDYHKMGIALADAACGVIEGFKNRRLSDGLGEKSIDGNGLGFYTTDVSLPSRALPSGADKIKLYEEYEKLRAVGAARTHEENMSFKTVEEVRRRIEEGDGPFNATLQIIKIGGFIFAAIPGEVFNAMGREIAGLSKNHKILTAGYANGYVGYIAPRYEWERGGYEVGLGMWSKVSHEAYGIILNAIKQLVDSI